MIVFMRRIKATPTSSLNICKFWTSFLKIYGIGQRIDVLILGHVRGTPGNEERDMLSQYA